METMTPAYQSVYSLFTDHLSQEIFSAWADYHTTGRWSRMIEVCFSIYTAHTGFALKTQLTEAKVPLILFGAGGVGCVMWRVLNEMGVQAAGFTDNNPCKQGAEHCTLPVFPPQQLQSLYPNALILITATSPVDASSIREQLLELGYGTDQMIDICRGFGTQYFDVPQLRLGKDEIFVDAGSLNGGDCITFLDRCGGQYRQVHVFEPDTNNFEICQKNLTGIKNCQLHQAGLWDRSDTLCFSSNSGCSQINDHGTLKVPVVALDEELGGQPVTFMKMDIEGAEQRALHGAQKTIRRCRPKLAVCVYHEKEDIVEIPLYLKALCPDYRFVLRQYAFGPSEAVLYAY